MVSLRSGKRTNRASTGNVSTPVQQEPAEESTPKRPARGKKAPVAAKVFEDVVPSPERESSTSSVEEIVLSDSPVNETVSSPVKSIQTHTKTLAPTPVKKAERVPSRTPSPDIFADVHSDSDEVVLDSTEEVVGDGEKESQQQEEVVDVDMEDDSEDVVVLDDDTATEEKSDNEEEEDEEEDDDDMPMEISSKKDAPVSEKAVPDSEDDDEPMEVTSKTVPEMPQKSVVEQLLEKKANKAAKLAEKKLKKRSKKKESKKIDEGFYQVKMKKSKAKFNVVTLKSGVQKMLEPEVNFREQLLQARTAGTRVTSSQSFQHRAQWVSKRS